MRKDLDEYVLVKGLMGYEPFDGYFLVSRKDPKYVLYNDPDSGDYYAIDVNFGARVLGLTGLETAVLQALQGGAPSFDTVTIRREIKELQPQAGKIGLAEIFGYFLPRKAREEIYQCLLEEVRLDLIEAQARSDSPLQLSFIRAATAIRMFWYFANTVAVVLRGSLGNLVFEIFRIIK